jgi:hypothetical protein
MLNRKIVAALLLAAGALTQAQAQESDAATGRSPAELYQRGYNSATTAGQAPDPASAAQVAAVNDAANAATAGNVARVAPADQAQYEADRAAYVDGLIAHNAAVDRTDARYARQQAAYADAMAAWRLQVAACKKGKRKACEMPPPDIADYYY